MPASWSYVVQDGSDEDYFDAGDDEQAKRHMQLSNLFGTLYRLDPGPPDSAQRHFVWERRSTRPPPAT